MRRREESEALARFYRCRAGKREREAVPLENLLQVALCIVAAAAAARKREKEEAGCAAGV